MKTNANAKTIIQAVENVSKRKYEGNVVLRKQPEKITKNVSRFTLKTLDADKGGSLVTKHGVKQTKANWDVHQDVMNEILNLDPRSHIYVDTIYGRQHHQPSQMTHTMNESEVLPKRVKRPRKTKDVVMAIESNDNNDNRPTPAVANLIQAIKYIIQNPVVLND